MSTLYLFKLFVYVNCILFCSNIQKPAEFHGRVKAYDVVGSAQMCARIQSKRSVT